VANADSGDRLREVVDRLQGEVVELRSSRKRLAEAAHANRLAIERALHDGVQQHLVALAVDLRRLAGLVEGDPAAAKVLLDEMAANLREALDATTELAQRVYPPLLEARGFASALRSAAASAGVTASVKVLVHGSYPPEIMAAVYWCCVEALASAPAGTQATISVVDADGALAFEIGVAGGYREGRLEGLGDRIEALGGRVTIGVNQDGGLRVAGSLPRSGER
jgi:signal transduction histidine kinase